MKILSVSECASWLTDRNVGFVGRDFTQAEYLVLPKIGYQRVFQVPSEAREQVMLAYKMASWFSFEQALMWLSVWTGHEPLEMDILLQIRQHYGSYKQLIEAPGMLFSANSSRNSEISVILLLLMAFNWEGYLLSDDLLNIVWVADEVIEVWSQNKTKFDELDNDLNYLGIRILK